MNLLRKLTFAGVVLLLTACKGFNVDTAPLTFSAEGGTKSVFVESERVAWAATSSATWININPPSGNNDDLYVNVTVNKNVDTKARDAVITFNAGSEGIYAVSISQEAAEAILTVSPADLTFSGASGEKDEITITANGHWTVSNIPDWLNIPSSGDGNTKCKLETLSANDTDEDRVVELRISTEGKSATLKVTQKALRVKCYIEPQNLVALWDEVGFELKPTGDVNKYKYIIHLGDDIDKKRVTDKEIEEELKQEDENKLADNDPVFFPDWFYSDGNYYYMQSDTKYYICTISYDSNDNPGKLMKTPIKTLKAVNPDYDAYVTINDAVVYADALEFECRKEAYCDTYHLIYGNMPSTTFTRVLFAFEINYYLKNNKKHWFAQQRDLKIETFYPNTHTFVHYYTKSLTEFPLVIIAAWGVFKDGSVSSDMNYAYLDTSEEANALSQQLSIQQQPIRKKSNVKQYYDRRSRANRVIYRSNVN